MKERIRIFVAGFALLLTLNAPLATGFAQTTAFTYQGRFNTNNVLYTGPAEFQFTLWDAASGGSAVATNNPATLIAAVADGLFTATLDFGSSPFNGQPRFLQIDARTTIGTFTPLTPRQPVTATPYALTASNLTGTLPAGQLGGSIPSANLSGTYAGPVTFNNAANSFSGNGGALTGLNASQVTTGTLPDARLSAGVARLNQVWQLGGNTVVTNQFLGSTNSATLELRANNEPALRLTSVTSTNFGVIPNVIGGYKLNTATLNLFGNTTIYAGATIAGGGYSNNANFVFADLGTVSGGADNWAFGVGSLVAGGTNNRALGDSSTVLGGTGNIASNSWSVAGGGGCVADGRYSIALGYINRASGENSTALGSGTKASGRNSTALGDFTLASGYRSTAMGYNALATGQNSTAMGFSTKASGESSTAMGSFTTAEGNYSTAMGRHAKALQDGSFVWADDRGTDFNSTASNQFSIRASGGVRLDDDATSPTDLDFGAKARQMINLFSDQYGIGVQSGTTYFRSGTRFSWFKQGVHSDTQNDPGTGGSVLMTVTSSGLTVNGVVVSSSDRNAKEDFKPVDAVAVLA